MLSPTVLKVPHCTDVIPPCTEYPPQYWRYPPLYWSYSPLYWTTSTVLKVSPTALKLSHTCTAVMPLTVVKVPSHSTEGTLQSTDVFHSTDVIPGMYWGCPPQYWSYPPLYWASSTVLKLSSTVLMLSPNVLNNLQCTESLHSTELTLYGVEFEFAAVNLNLPWWILIYRDSCGPP